MLRSICLNLYRNYYNFICNNRGEKGETSKHLSLLLSPFVWREQTGQYHGGDSIRSIPCPNFFRGAVYCPFCIAPIFLNYLERRLSIMTFKNKVKSFLKISCISKTDFCKKCDISLTSLCQWLNDKRYVSDELQQKMADFMTDYVKALVELTQD